MALSPELKRLVSGAQARHADPLGAKRAEICARLLESETELAEIEHYDPGSYEPSIRERLAWLGLQKASKKELREIVVKAMARDPDA